MTFRALARIAHGKPALAAPFLAGVLAITSTAPVAAQEEVSEARLRKVEAEIRALQRKVFPGGDQRFFEPEIQAEDGAPAARASGPSTTAVTDILARLDAIEVQLQQLTAKTEENANAIELLGRRVVDLETADVPAQTPEEIPETTVEAVEAAPEQESKATASNLAAMGASQSADEGEVEGPSATGPTGPTAERLAAVQAITKPQSGDAADDEYSYGFRLWNAGFYPEARQQLSRFVETYTDHWRVSYGRNLLGRAYLDDGMPREAAQWFFKNYQADKMAARAPDSLLFLAESMVALEDTRRACIALAEFGETYPAVAAGRLMNAYQSSKDKVDCETDEG